MNLCKWFYTINFYTFERPKIVILKRIHVIARFKIHDGQLSDFKKLVEECLTVTKNETGVELYDWFIDESNQCTVIETYKDSDAVFAHLANVGGLLAKLMEISDFSGEVFGNVSPALEKALLEMQVKPVPFFQGL